ncbi:type I methionyl aminopeptidase [Candidatus Microgenomates bacterium]|nr:type I methionyl aminopeptidase [Candidatus Microgenomates bacterium]
MSINDINIKTPEELKIMEEGGKKLSYVKHSVRDIIDVGVSADDLEKLAADLIEKAGGKASFKMVPGYSWATCVNVNSGIVHGIPHKSIIFKKGDVVSVDMGLFYKGFHTDTSFTVAISPPVEVEKFLDAGKKALSAAISAVKPGNRIYDISGSIEDLLTLFGYTPIRDLVGHGIGVELHEAPAVPCFVEGTKEDSPLVEPGMALAIEVMYSMGNDPSIVKENDGWTIGMRDGKISGLFEDTVIVTQKGSRIITG